MSITATTAASLVETQFSSVNGKTYNYIIVGGGLSGLMVANRLTEDKKGKSYSLPNKDK